jgi:hypothetical protein
MHLKNAFKKFILKMNFNRILKIHFVKTFKNAIFL